MQAGSPLPLARFAGSPEEIGRQLGVRYRASIRQGVEDCQAHPPAMSKAEVRAHLAEADRLLRRDFPKVYAETVATAQAAGVPLDAYLLTLYEELWDRSKSAAAAGQDASRGCTDVVARRSATLHGELLVGHNNDMTAAPWEPVLLQFYPQDGVPFTTWSIDGYALSIVCNRAGMVFTGNEVTADDVRPGIPRLLLMRIVAETTSLADAVDVLEHPDRASSYNNIVSDSAGNVIDIEGSATESVEIPLRDDTLVHTNHYLSLKHRAGEPPTESSEYRLRRATYLLDEGRGQHTVDTFKSLLSDHRLGRDDGICRHGQYNTATKFSMVFQPEQGLVHYCMGNACLLPYMTLRYI